MSNPRKVPPHRSGCGHYDCDGHDLPALPPAEARPASDMEVTYHEARKIASGHGGRLRPRREHLIVLIELLDRAAVLATGCPNPHCDGRGRLVGFPGIGCAVCFQSGRPILAAGAAPRGSALSVTRAEPPTEYPRGGHYKAAGASVYFMHGPYMTQLVGSAATPTDAGKLAAALESLASRLGAPRAEPDPYNSTIGRLDKIIHWAREWIDEDSAHGFPRLILAEAQQLRSEWPRISAGALPDESERALAGCYRAAYVGICFGCPPEISPHDLLRPLVEAAKDAAPYGPRAEPGGERELWITQTKHGYRYITNGMPQLTEDGCIPVKYEPQFIPDVGKGESRRIRVYKYAALAARAASPTTATE